MMQKSELKLGQFVRVKQLRYNQESKKYDEKEIEGVVSSILFENNFELSYVKDEMPYSQWFDYNLVKDIELL